MKPLHFLIGAIFCLFSLIACQKDLPNPPESYGIIPQPLKMEMADGKFIISSKTRLLMADDSLTPLVEFFAGRINQVSGLHLIPETGLSKRSQTISWVIVSDSLLGNEGYRFSASSKKILMEANTTRGLFYAMQTLFQLLPAEIYGGSISDTIQWSVPAVTITDVPRFGYRGLHLDVCRHFMPLDFVKKYIDLMSMQKMNVFHWHLTDDQGWRIEIKKYPRLTEVGSQRKETVVGHAGRSKEYDGIPHGGFYTQEEIKEMVAYAKARFVTIIPEIEMPGHALAALASYPELGCTGGPYEVCPTFGIFEDVFCAGKEETFTFFEDVLTEVMALFPGEYIHIGGDECPKVRWERCPRCQARMKTMGLKDEMELQSYFVQRIEKFLNSKGRRIIGWDEILEGGLAPNATVMSWRGEEGGIAAAQSGHDAIMTPGEYCYLDKYQGDPATEPLTIGGMLSLEKIYSYEPIPKNLDSAYSGHILGAQGNVWTEYMINPERVEYMAYPRANALAEILWSSTENRNWDSYHSRLQKQFNRWEQMNVHFARK
ncbi:MAG: beta-N-acetylhexosaminidase [Bacteroidales bacterium]|nr:beta-N-acetylhexosaminidase [Bacteroidales bacterium]